MEETVSVVEAARILKVTRQAIYFAIRCNKIKVYKLNDKYRIFKKDLNDYFSHKYSRDRIVIDGKPLFDEKNGIVSAQRAADILGVPLQKIYHAARTGKIRAERRRSSWIIYVEDLLRYQYQYMGLNRITIKQEA